MLRPAISHRVGGVEMIPPGGADVVFRFLGMVHSADTNCWDLLDGNLRVCLAQGWLSRERAPEEGRDERAAVLGSSFTSRDPVIAEMLSALLERWAHVYADLGGRPCLVSGTRIVALDMERVMVTREDFAGSSRRTHKFRRTRSLPDCLAASGTSPRRHADCQHLDGHPQNVNCEMSQ